MTPPSNDPARRPAWYKFSLAQQVMIGLVLGCILGWIVGQLSPSAKEVWVEWLKLGRDVFLHLIKAMLAPLVFACIVQGIAGSGDMKKVGRVGAKALVYFEVVTTLALVVGLVMVNLLGPGRDVVLAGGTSALSSVAQSKPLSMTEIVLHTFPTSLIDAMARNDVLQIVAFAVIFALSILAAGEAGKPVLKFVDSLSQVMFKFAGIVMLFAPVGVGAAIAATVSAQGISVLLDLGKLVGTLYLSLVVFVVLVLGTVIWIMKIPLKPFVRAVKEPFMLAFATANSEAALPKAFDNMERLGVSKSIVSFVLPAGYTFNLDGSTLYLAVASVFIAQAAEATTGIHFGLGQQITMMLVLMITSKGVAAVPRASLVVLIAALQSFNLPLEGAALILGVDALLDMARTSVNVLGNCLASAVVARWEGEFDDAQAQRAFGDASGPAV